MQQSAFNRPPKNNKKSRNGNRRPPRGGATIIPRPQQINGYEVNHKVRMRFTTNAAVSQVITFQNLCDTILMVTSATAGYQLFRTVRVRRVRCWAIPTLGQSVSVTVIFNSDSIGSFGDRKVHQDSSMGIEPAYVSCSPALKSLACDFQGGNQTNDAFFIECPTGSVIDVDLSFRGDALGAAPNVAQNALVAATVGTVGYRGLDGLAKATTLFTVPTSFNSV